MDTSSVEINLRTLQRIDSSVNKILSSATQIAFYKFNINKSDWKKLDIEGSLFVVSKNNSKNCSLIVINRLNTNNVNDLITTEWSIKLDNPYILYKNEKGVHCLWFYDVNECENVYKKLAELTQLNNKVDNGIPIEVTLAKFGIDIKSTENDKTLPLIPKPSSNPNSQQNNDKDLLPKPDKEVKKNIFNFNEKQSINNSSIAPGTVPRSLNLQELFGNDFMIPKIEETNVELNDQITTPIKNENNLDKINDEILLTPAILKQNKSKLFNEKKELKNGLCYEETSPSLIGYDQQNFNIYKPKFLHTQKNNSTKKSNQISMEHLKQSLIYLLQNDADFLHQIHTVYTNTINNN